MDHDADAAHRAAAPGGAAAAESAADVPPINPPSNTTITIDGGVVNYIIGNATGHISLSGVACPRCNVGGAGKVGSAAR
jgi:hypothetical protein